MASGCHYVKIKDLGKVLIPGCIAVSVSNDIDDCTCYVRNGLRLSSSEMIHSLKKEIKELKLRLKKYENN